MHLTCIATGPLVLQSTSPCASVASASGSQNLIIGGRGVGACQWLDPQAPRRSSPSLIEFCATCGGGQPCAGFHPSRRRPGRTTRAGGCTGNGDGMTASCCSALQRSSYQQILHLLPRLCQTSNQPTPRLLPESLGGRLRSIYQPLECSPHAGQVLSMTGDQASGALAGGYAPGQGCNGSSGRSSVTSSHR